MSGLEPLTPASQTRCATELRYTPLPPKYNPIWRSVQASLIIPLDILGQLDNYSPNGIESDTCNPPRRRIFVLASFLLSLREGLEVALILSIVLGTLRKLDRAHDAKVVWFGTSSAVLFSLFFAMILQWLGASLEGIVEEIYEGTMMLMAAGVLTWVIFWMQRQSRSLKSQIEAGVRKTSQMGGRQALFILAFLLVLREGAELAIFLTTTAITSGVKSVLLGALLGLGTAIFLGWSLFANLVRLNVQRFFQITSVLLLFFAAGLVAQGIHELNEIGWIPAVVEHVWDINPWLDEKSVLGQMLRALFGYNGNPSLSEVLGYLLYWGGMFWGIRWVFLSSAAPQRA